MTPGPSASVPLVPAVMPSPQISGRPHVRPLVPLKSLKAPLKVKEELAEHHTTSIDAAAAAAASRPATVRPKNSVQGQPLLGVKVEESPRRQRFSSTPPTTSPQTSAQAVTTSTAEAADAGVTTVLFTSLPEGWALDDVRDMCMQYGFVMQVRLSEGKVYAIFRVDEAAKKTVAALNGQTTMGKGDRPCTLKCELVTSQPPAQTEEWLGLHFDELVLAAGDPLPTDREVFLRHLPHQDCIEKEFHDWLSSFGTAEDVTFLKNPSSGQLTGSAYARFSQHVEAAALISAFPADVEGEVQATWSLSERLNLGRAGRADILSAVVGRLGYLRDTTKCLSLTIAGESRKANAADSLPNASRGPLRFAWSRKDCRTVTESLRKILADILGQEVVKGDPAPWRAKRRRENRIEQLAAKVRRTAREKGTSALKVKEEPEEDAPHILVRGFPASWKEPQVRHVFGLFGGVRTVDFVGTGNSRAARVKLKEAGQTSKVVEKLNNTRVGDGEQVEMCTISCEVTEEHANESFNLRRWPPQFFRTSNSGKVVGRVTLPSAELDIEVNEGLRTPRVGALVSQPVPDSNLGAVKEEPSSQGEKPPGNFGPTNQPHEWQGAAPPPPSQATPFGYPLGGRPWPVWRGAPGFPGQPPGYMCHYFPYRPPWPQGRPGLPEAECASVVKEEPGRSEDHKNVANPLAHDEEHRQEARKDPKEAAVPKRDGVRAKRQGRRSKGERNVGVDEVRLQKRITHGLAQIELAQVAAVDNPLKAYDHYVRGLRHLLKLDKTHSRVAAMQTKIAGYVREAELLKEELDARGQRSPSRPPRSRSVRCRASESRDSRSRGTFGSPRPRVTLIGRSLVRAKRAT